MSGKEKDSQASGQVVFSRTYNIESESNRIDPGEARHTGRRVFREDGTEALEFIEDDDPQEVKVRKRLQGATRSPGFRVFRDGKELEKGNDYQEIQ